MSVSIMTTLHVVYDMSADDTITAIYDGLVDELNYAGSRFCWFRTNSRNLSHNAHVWGNDVVVCKESISDGKFRTCLQIIIYDNKIRIERIVNTQLYWLSDVDLDNPLCVDIVRAVVMNYLSKI